MNCSRSTCDDFNHRLSQWVTDVGGVACGVAHADAVCDSCFDAFEKWLQRGMHADMHYMEHHRPIRRNPELLLEGACSVIVVAFSYYHSDQTDGALASIAAYAHGDDYHEVVRRKLEEVASHIRSDYGGATRVCVDTAPLLERYWAVQAGVGFVGRNRLLIVPGAGSYVFIGVILTTVEFPCSTPSTQKCDNCGRCIEACPGKALSDDGVDSRRCLSYLTIEHRGELPDSVDLCNRLYGCDMCQRVCPHNNSLTDTVIREFHARNSLRHLTPEKVIDMEQQEFSAIMSHSAIKRAKLAGLQRNAKRILRK